MNKNHRPDISRTSAFGFSSLKEARDVFFGEKEGFAYTRVNNPSFVEAEKKIAELEGAKYALVFSSGMAAIISTILAFSRTGDVCLVGDVLYGGSDKFFSENLPNLGTTVLRRGVKEFERAIHTNTPKFVFTESPNNPCLEMVNLSGIAKVSKKTGSISIIDNTFATPFFQIPILHGIDIVVESASKYLNGHGDLLAGIVATNDEGYFEKIREMRTALGGILSPDYCTLLMRGLETFNLRMERHGINALLFANFIEKKVKTGEVEKVFYPGRLNLPFSEEAEYSMVEALRVRNPSCVGSLHVSEDFAFGGVVSFVLNNKSVDLEKFVNSLIKSGIAFAVSLGCTDTMFCNPFYMTHAQVSEIKKKRIGIDPYLLRVSLGIEDFDIIEDVFIKAFKRGRK